jgi:hypothetical protein
MNMNDESSCGEQVGLVPRIDSSISTAKKKVYELPALPAYMQEWASAK